jgi:hypothetical protein
VLLLKEEKDVASACVRARWVARERRRSVCERRSAHERWSLGAHAETVSVRLGHNARVHVDGGAALQVMLAARHGDPAVGVGCRAWEPSGAWARGSRRDAVHECMRRERRHNAQARESVERWPEVRERAPDICMSMKRKQHDWVHGADKLRHERAYARGSRADAVSHGSIQVGHVCEARELGLTDGARLAAR